MAESEDRVLRRQYCAQIRAIPLCEANNQKILDIIVDAGEADKCFFSAGRGATVVLTKLTLSTLKEIAEYVAELK